ncbi:hypothetical protein [Deinococcus peraridilitoris]|uniref:Uncharacterized protein n=1 Tax=Deinococcus peraridilitoris (strain DSM 19664 / LMG 22246 / CIP 109416 / KR-200) TaxID=937777 RepID=L0A0U5_DEIPD|nr:hypothetical protein [Deinococcus peraridilitoris]AFZ67079.1 hypothetical protein Deipe_1538 [Deinococcus peraridilitoris DSM 19664]
MKNMKHRSQDGRGITLALTVPAGATNGRPVALGGGGLYGVLETERVTADMLKAGTAPQGLREGQASVNLPGIGQTIDVGALPVAIADFGRVYLTPAGAPSEVAAGNTWIGWRLGNFVGLRSNGAQ